MLTSLCPFLFAWFWTGASVPTAAPVKPAPAPVLRAQPAEKPPASPTAGAIRVAPPAPATSPEADKVVKGVQEFYRTTQQLSAKFRQSFYNKTFGLPKVNDGRVYLKKPGKMRWDYFNKRNKNQIARSQLSDGKMIWAVDQGGKWYYRQSLEKSDLPVAVTFLTGKGDLSKEFNARILTGSKFGTATDKVLELTPKKPSAQFKTLVLVVDPSNYRVKKSVVTTATGDTNEYSFYEPDTAKAVDDKIFVFNPAAAKGFREIKAEDAPQK